MSSDTMILNSCMYNYEYFQQEDVCRLCWNTNAITDIFDEKSNSDDIKVPILDKIRNCLDIDLTLNTYPRKICEKCKSEIENFYLFKTFCRETDRKLQNILKEEIFLTEAVKTETNEEDINIFDSYEDLDICLKNESETEQEKKDIKPSKKQEPKKRKKKLIRPPTYCKYCKIDLKDSDSFAKHSLAYHGLVNGAFKCFGCEKVFKSRKRCISHEVNFCWGLKDGYKCPSCGRYLPTRKMYDIHIRDRKGDVCMKVPDKIFQCVQCAKRFKSKESLNKHAQEHNTKKSYVCESCGRVFSRRDYLHKHKLMHSGVKEHVCPHCDFKTSQRTSLVLHIRRHTGERPYSCDICPQKCISSSNLRAHTRRHLGIKQHQCTICGKKFGYKLSLSEHICSVHEPTPQACHLCPAKYSRPTALRRHMRDKHTDKQTDIQTG